MEEQQCDHSFAVQKTRGGKSYFYCLNCDSWVDPELDEIVPEPAEDGDPHAGKALAPTSLSGVGAQANKSRPTTQRRYSRSKTLQVQVRCQHLDPQTNLQCPVVWKVWPQNVALSQYCPKYHHLSHNRALGLERIRRYRQLHRP